MSATMTASRWTHFNPTVYEAEKSDQRFVRTYHLCQPCSAAQMTILSAISEAHSCRKKVIDPTGWTNVTNSAEDGCHLCMFIVVSLTEESQSEKSAINLAQLDWSLEITFEMSDSELPHLKVDLYDQSGRRMTSQLSIATKDDLIKHKYCSPGLFATAHLPCPLSTSSKATWDLTMRWLYDCTRDHPECSPQDEEVPFLPRRLIDVGGDGNKMLRLVSRDDIPCKRRRTRQGAAKICCIELLLGTARFRSQND
ncbi:hypothetical protein BJ170DRAFT_435294 [Xylariales sp. AK1849]|nr:hypothetical protein BJ170DRAFT_435294 [Xylariales sp. AK1849]